METSDSNALPEERAKILRADLKNWEKEFSSRNNGRKASRTDIKQNLEIAAKYKEYNRLRDALAHHAPHTSQIKLPQSKVNGRKKDSPKIEYNYKEKFLTPQKRKISTEGIGQIDSPSVAKCLFTPRKVSVGPTPQKEGQVLGLFDLLSDSESNVFRNIQKDVDPRNSNVITINNQKTPPRSQEKKDQTALDKNLTPASSSKRRRLDAFSTPSKNSRSEIYQGVTPLSVSKLNFSTPLFLRRENSTTRQPLDVEDFENYSFSPQKIRCMKRKPPIRGLSSFLADLRESQDENLDQELELLREIEADEINMIRRKPVASATALEPTPKDAESLADHPKISFSQAGDNDSPFCNKSAMLVKSNIKDQPVSQNMVDDQPSVVYKKKGQKRTTRLVKMRPTRSKPPSTMMNTDGSVDYNHRIHQGNSGLVIPFQNISATPTLDSEHQARNFNSDSQSEYTASEGETRYYRPNQRKESSKVHTSSTRVVCSNKESIDDREKEQLERASTHKVSALSLQNFRRLKLRNSGSKGPSATARNGRNKKFAKRR
ncbi:putative dna replication regulator sld2 [Erysiphe necator]|uniref:DNA replication regulator SLD2 n=1 Tax=Uncinula necator TaxID=52586 RepID=A0A0B1P8H4_UNCNE|nr:putative dna replication regulator sld2 [Erysiphe necator]